MRTEAQSGEDVKYVLTNENIREIDLDIGNARVYIKGDQDNSVITGTNIIKDSLNISENNGKLTVKLKLIQTWLDYLKGFRLEDATLVINLPKGIEFEIVRVKSGMAYTEISDIRGKKFDVEGGMGSVVISNIDFDSIFSKSGMGLLSFKNTSCDDLEMESGMGEIKFQGDVMNKGIVKSGMGSVNMTLARKEADYRFQIKNGLGSVSINSNRSNGVSQYSYGTGLTDIRIESGMGEVKIRNAE